MKDRSKLLSCLSVIRNSLANSNKEVSQLLQSTSFEKSKVYDKIVVLMITSCKSKLKDSEIDNV